MEKPWLDLILQVGVPAALLIYLVVVDRPRQEKRQDKKDSDHLLALSHVVDRMEAQRQLDRETGSRQVAGLHESIDDLGVEIRNYANGRSKP